MDSIDVNITNMIKCGDRRLILVCANITEVDKLKSKKDNIASFFLSQLRWWRRRWKNVIEQHELIVEAFIFNFGQGRHWKILLKYEVDW